MIIRMIGDRYVSIPYNGMKNPCLLEKANGWVTVEDKIGRLLIGQGAAEAREPDLAAEPEPVQEPEPDDEAIAEPTDYDSMTKAELVEIAKELGIPTGNLRSKKALIEAIEAAEAEPTFGEVEE